MLKPNLFIVGAPRCGTTFLYHYLGNHPDIYMCKTKEIGYFGRDVYPKPLTLNKYLTMFKLGKKARYRGEASTWYLYSKLAAKKIKKFNPYSKILLMIRNPIDSIYSLYYWNRYEGRETLSLEDALKADNLRKTKKFAHKLPVAFNYKSTYMYATQIKRYFDTFGRENVKVIVFEEFMNNTEKIYKQILYFLKVDESFIPEEYKKINPNIKIKSLFFESLYRNEFIFSISRKVLPKNIRKKIGKTIHLLNTKPDKRPPMNVNIKRSLIKYFREDVKKTSKLIGKDLNYWLEVSD